MKPKQNEKGSIVAENPLGIGHCIALHSSNTENPVILHPRLSRHIAKQSQIRMYYNFGFIFLFSQKQKQKQKKKENKEGKI